MWDVIVVGAGPAGSTAASVLSRKGDRTLLADKLDNDRSRTGVALPGAAVRLLRSLDLLTPEIGSPHASIRSMLASWNSDALLATDSIRDPYGPGWRLDRRYFDAELRKAAVGAGVEF